MMLLIVGVVLINIEKINRSFISLEWREYIFFIYAFHMLFGERHFGYVGFEPLFVTEIVIAILTISYANDLIKVRRVLFVYYLLVAIGLSFAFVYFFQYGLDAIRDSFMLLYAFWVPIIYHIFRSEKQYDLFFSLIKLFIVLKAIAYCYEAAMIIMGYQSITFEGFRFGVGYVMPSLIVIALFLPLKTIGWKYKILSLMMIPAVFTIFHRSIFLGIILAILVIFISGGVELKRTIIKYGVTSLIFLIGFLIYYNSIIDVNIFDVLEAKSSLDEGNINFRFISWQYVLDNFYDHFLLGYGVGRPIMYVYQNVFYPTIDLSYFEIRDLGGNAQPHNSYLNILARFGVLIFPIFLYAIFQPIFKFMKYINKKRVNGMEPYTRYLLLTGFLMIMYVLAFFNVVLEGPHHSFPFWMAIGMLLSFGRSGNFTPKTIRIEKAVSS
ncbi:MAG: O-antigen ligase family protein [Candidatus Paceibacterota bacterium]